MQRVNDPVIREKHAEVAKLIERNQTVADWKRDLAAEQRLNSPGDASSASAYCFEIRRPASTPSSFAWQTVACPRLISGRLL